MRSRTKTPITLLSIGVLPLLFCTACNKVSQYSLPIIYNATYSTTSNPYFSNKDSVYVDSTNTNRKYDFGNGKSYLTEQNSLIDDLPKQTIVKQDQSISKIYCQPTDDSGWDGDGGTSWPNRHAATWYLSNDDKLKTSETLKGITAPDDANKDFNKDYSIFTSPRNWNLATLGESNAGIGSAISTYTQAMLGFLSQPGILSRDDAGVNNILSSLFGSRPTTGSAINNFYELMCDYNNVLDVANGKAKFGLSNQSFNYVTSPFIVDFDHPLLTSTADRFSFKDQKTFGATPKRLNDIYDSANNKIKDDFFGSDSTTANFQSMYVGYTLPATMSKDDKSNPLCYPTTWGAAVPVVINPTTTQFNYFNPVKNRGLNQNDYLTSDINDVKSLVSKSKSWDKIYSKHNLGKPDPKNLSYQIYCSRTNPSSSKFTGDNFASATAKKNTDNNESVRNPTLLNTAKGYGGYIPAVFDGVNWQNQVSDDSYIAFFNLAWIGFPINELDSQNNKTFQFKYVPYLGSLAADAKTSMPAVFPARLFMNDDNSGFDSKVITGSLIPAAQTLLQSTKPDSKDPLIPKDKQDAFKNNPSNMCYYFDIAKLAEKQNKALKYLNERNLSINQELPTDGDGKNAIDIIKALYNFSNNDWSKFIVPSTTPY